MPSFNNKEPWLFSVNSAKNCLFPNFKSIWPVFESKSAETSSSLPPVFNKNAPPSLYLPETSSSIPDVFKLKEALFSVEFIDVPIETPSIFKLKLPWPKDLSPEILNSLPSKFKPK